MTRVALIAACAMAVAGCGPSRTHHAKPKGLPDDVMTAVQFKSITIGMSVNALGNFYKRVKDDKDESGDTIFKSADGKGIYVIRYGCREGATVMGDGSCGRSGDEIVASKEYDARVGQ